MDLRQTLNDSSRAVYARLNRRKYAIIIALCLFCFFACIGDVLTAAASPAYRLSTRDVLNCLLHPTQATPGTYVIVIKMRLPIALMALVVGFSLGTAGATMQTILHNPLASPYTLGVGTAAGFGASIAIVFGLGSVMTSALAFVFAMLICLIRKLARSNSTESMMLLGSCILYSVTSFFVFSLCLISPLAWCIFGMAAGLADKVEVQLAYAIGVARPVSVMVDSFGTGKLDDEKLSEIVEKHFDLRPAAIIHYLDLRRPIYRQTAAYGHFGRTDIDLPWEQTDKVAELQAEL